ncbi:hypothetical protein RHSIM_Rhsim10G0034100 [Rhododendron simsii]|uniref:Leucine-rich repeat-containing N-terminal plant-type domain-containing protein n=1 Tax=Rhododendron simsii TaxID=118357 RepID=A0A834GE99_RHOSS|nr:hypothetical protein RHSIM_Rhsim10G0034100 [Rhododendron simsii]
MERLIKLVLSNNLLFGLITEFPEHVSVDTIGNTDLLYPTKPSPTQKMMKTLSVGLLVAVASAVSTFVTFIGPAVFLPLYKKAAQIQSEEHFLSLRSLQETLLPQMVFTDPTSMGYDSPHRQPKMRRYAHTTSLMLLLFFMFHLVVSEIPSNQRNTMINLYNLLQNNTGQPPLPWNINRDPCSWKGVACNSDNSSITGFSIQFFSLSNPDFLPVLCQINSLESVDLSDNHLSSIPSGFMTACGNLRGLRELNFSRNKLSGSLPNFDGFLKLESLDLSHNSLSGTISLQLDGLISLKILSLGYNYLVGKIPEEIANYSNLTFIDLSFNNLSGSIPDRFKELLNLQVLILSSNSLSGRIPQFLSSIHTLDLSYNQLNGSIPSDLLSQPNLEIVDLSDNSLGGSIPESISSSLVRLRLGNNRLNGTIPSSSFVSLQMLTYLELDNNSLGGSIPPELGFCERLALLNLANNQLTGVLPVELGNLTKLQELKFQANSLVGEIPIEITQLQRLRKLNISWNSLNGPIPPSISSLQNLNNLDLRRNNLSGSIPASIDNLTSLIELQLGSNELSGKIPLMPQSLQIALNLSSNQFEGLLPENLSQLTGLEVLDLSNNRFTGKIPDSFAQMESLTQLVLSNNRLSGLIPVFSPYVSVEASGNPDLIEPTRPNGGGDNTRTLFLVVAVPIGGGVFAIFIATMLVLWISSRPNKNNDEQIESEEHRSNISGKYGYSFRQIVNLNYVS